MRQSLDYSEMVDLGREVAAAWTPGFNVNGRIATNVEMQAVLEYRHSDEAQLQRRVDDWCRRFDQWVRENLTDGDRNKTNSTAETKHADGPDSSQDDGGQGKVV